MTHQLHYTFSIYNSSGDPYDDWFELEREPDIPDYDDFDDRDTE